MNKKVFSLVRAMLKNGFGLGIRDSKRSTKTFLILALGLSIPILLFGISGMFHMLISTFMQIDQSGLILKVGIGINSGMIFVFGIFYVISTFYFSTDVEYLLPLPLKPWEIVSAKFIVVVIYEYLITAILYLPMLLIYGLMLNMGLIYYIYGIIVFVFLPIVPLALASFLVMLIMRFTNLTRYKDLLKILGGMLALFVGIGITILLQNVSMDMSPEAILEMIEGGSDSLVGLLPDIFPTTGWASQALLYSSLLKGLWYFCLYIGATIGVYGVILAFGQIIYLKGAVGLSEAGVSKRNKGLGNTIGRLRERPPLISYALVELKILIRTPVYFMNCIIINFLWPFLLLLPLFTGGSQVEQIGQITSMLKDPKNAGIVLAVAFAFVLFTGASNGISSSAMSREGENIMVKKYLPTSYRTQLNAKVLSAMIIGLVAILVLLLLGTLAFELPLYLGLLILIISPLALLFVSLTGLMIDLINPNFTWDNEQKAVKQNINVFLNILIGVILTPIVIVPPLLFSWSLVNSLAILTAAFILLDVVLYTLLSTRGIKIFHSL